ncbi:E3 ubiquitin-protein ligase APD2 isoform X1 [Coffea arabica]|uniref:E3 ubiquitin-protein ligase APD2 isoform X1 n=1 Tax=Coffea arabica TaxID=13443 RepID=A0A6P6SMN6_COFAR|nr:uncharacterized protein LOC113692781 isoform X1 [Coffea arabica]
MENNNQSPPTTSAASSSPSTDSTRNGEDFGVASTSSTNSQVQEEETAAAEEEAEGNGLRYPELIQQRTSLSYNAYSTVTENAHDVVGRMRGDSLSCFVVILAYWFFVSMTMIMGVYGPASLLLGPYSSILIKPNSFFVEYVKIAEIHEAANGVMLYGFHKDPPLDVVTSWSETHKTTLFSGNHKEWIYFLNEGSQVNVSYDVNSPSSSSLVFVIAQGSEGLNQWLEDPSYPNSTLLWQIIRGSGLIQQDILTSSNYYVAIVNLNAEAVEVQLNMRLKTYLYNTTGAYYQCGLTESGCSFKLSFTGGHTALLTSPAPTPGRGNNESHVKLSYGPRWVTYVVGIGGMTILMLVAFHFFIHLRCTNQDGSRIRFGETGSARTPLLENKDDDISSWGSSYDSVSQDDEDAEEGQAAGSLEGISAKDGEYNNNIRRLCAICFDAPRDCFFLPCGHCVACFACGTRIAEAAGACPICRRNMKKVRKIFTV